MTDLNRRQLLSATATVAASATLPASAQTKADVAGKSVLITGSSSGFGRLGALHLARGGATVIASMRRLDGGRRKEAQELRDIAATEKLKLIVVEIDVTDDALVASGVAAAAKTAGGTLDALINNAGIAVGGPVEISDVEAVRLMFETNVIGQQRTARAVLPAMRARKQGLIINVSSQLGRLIVPNYGFYSATKFAVEAMSEQLAYELAPHGVEVTVVQPGGYPTLIWRNSSAATDRLLQRVDAERKAAYADLVATARRTENSMSTDPEDLARAFAELVAMAPGSRPLRRPVHPDTRATTAINAVSAQVQAAVLGNGPFAAWHKAVTS
jgi:NAD(P)-dependent dehydrogenase (short-subunit alcohol dehydrogenase family)